MRARGRFAIGRVTAGMVMRHRMVRVHLVAGVHGVMALPGDSHLGARPSPFRAQHRRRHRAPDGKQDGHQNQDEEAQVLHVKTLSDMCGSSSCVPVRPVDRGGAVGRCAERVGLSFINGSRFVRAQSF